MTRETDILNGIFNTQFPISKVDNKYTVFFLGEIDEYKLYDAESHGFWIKSIKPWSKHVDGYQFVGNILKFEKEPYCIHCGELEHDHNGQQTGNYCREEYLLEKGKDPKTLYVFCPEF